ncbi:MAG: 3-phosphoshikimate 1-carboxyvinyltransferase [Clostridia bacterium]|nr:3-phosphoshikimate 1-carboxyvinyltransferase [Clostridia bacterium]
MAHRALICAALAGEGSVIKNIGSSDDIRATGECLEALKKGAVCDCAESGSTLRFLLPIAALSGREVTFKGRGRLMERPQDAYADVFAEKGVKFVQSGGEITIQGPLPAGDYNLPGNVSSQFVSGLLMALPLTHDDSVITLSSQLESKAYVDMTRAAMADFGVKTEHIGEKFIVKGYQAYKPREYTVEDDWSAAAFFLCAAALGQDVACQGLDDNSLQGDREIVNILKKMVTPTKKLSAITVDARNTPDLVPPLAALMCLAEGTSRIVNAARLRYKESDRLSALATQLNALGADIAEEPEGLTIRGKDFLQGGHADACGDHRIAMAVALAAIRCKSPVYLTGWETVAKSYPAFWQDWEGE